MKNQMKEILQKMITANYDHRMRLHSSHEHLLSPTAFAREFRTIHLNIGRMSGKTQMIMSNARVGDIIITHNRLWCDELIKMRGECRAQITSIGSIRHATWLEQRIGNSYVWVDEPNLVGDLHDIYQKIRAELYILVGE